MHPDDAAELKGLLVKALQCVNAENTRDFRALKGRLNQLLTAWLNGPLHPQGTH